MDVLDAENEMIPIDVLRCSNFSYDTSPKKSSTDKKEYSVLKLTNGLTALLISDSSVTRLHANEEEDSEDETDDDDDDDEEDGFDDEYDESGSFSSSHVEESVSQSESSIGVSALEDDSNFDNERLGLSACAVCVDVGSFNDPEEMPGLSHLLEHVIGAGSRAYPDDDKFGTILNEFGGSFYSSTRCECATYYFDCKEDNLQFFLERFSKQLISPILDHDTIEDEIANIRYEFQNNVWYNDHVSRKLIMCSTADQTNPAHKLVNGNRITDDNLSRDTLLKYLCEFWKKNYSAHRITLVIQSSHSLKTLEMWVEEYFLNIPCNNLPAEVFPHCDTPFRTEEFCKLFTVEPIEEENILQISWVLPPTVQLYKSKPLHYIRRLLVQECTGSLTAYLRMKNWASNVSCNDHRSTVDFNSIYSLFSVKIHLTNSGVDNLEETWRIVFTYIAFLRQCVPVKWIFSEIKTVAEILFAHSKDIWPILNVKSLAENMRLYPSADYIEGEHLFSYYDADSISQLLDLMKPCKANIMITSSNKNDNVTLDNVEQWLGKKYNKSNYVKEFEENLTAKEYFCLPEANKFIVNDFHLLPPPEDNMFPEVISKHNWYEAWYKQESKFQKPEGCLILKFASPEANQSVRSYVMLELLTLALDRIVRQEIYPALTCGFDYSVDASEDGFEIFLYGFNEKLGLLLECVMRCIRKLEAVSDLISDEEYGDFFRTVISKSYLENKPFKLCYQLIRNIILTPNWSYFDKLSVDETEPLLKSHLDLFAKTFLGSSHLKCFLNGNISKEQAMDMVNIMINDRESPSANLEHKPYVRVTELTQGELFCKVQSFDKMNPYHYIMNYYQYGVSDMKIHCEFRLLIFIMKEHMNEKPLKEQIICNVYTCSYEKDLSIIGILVAVKSKDDLQLIDRNTTEFLQNFSLYLEELPVSRFQQLVAAFVKTIQNETIDLIDETYKLWNEISSHIPVFERQKKEIEATKNISVQQIRETFRKLIDSNSIRKLSVQVEAHKESYNSSDLVENDTNVQKIISSQTSEPTLVFINSKTNEKKIIEHIAELKSTQILYPISD